jgi:molecular chaperone DnaK
MEIYGIDFGTTNSATIGIDLEHVGYYGDDTGQPFPSIVAIDKMTGEVVGVGRDVWQQRRQLHTNCEIISSVKTYLGTDKRWNIGSRTWGPQEIATEIFRGLKEQVRKKRGEIDSAVVSIPIGFSPIKRRELRKAALKAGITINSFVSEPSAAVYKHYSDVYKWQKIAVFDWGGGTLDIAVVELNGGNVVELSTLGRRLGGDDIDYKIAEWAHNKILQATKGDIPFNEMASKFRDDMIVLAEELKRDLSSKDESSIVLYEYGDLQPPEIFMNGDQFESLVEPEIDRAITTLKEAIKKAKLSIDELGCILMVGGSSKLRFLVERIEDEFDCEIIPPDKNSDWHVAHGAALLNEKKGEYKLSQNIGLLLSDNTYYPLIKSGERVNHKKKSITFGLVEDSPGAEFIFLESESNAPDSSGIDRKTIGYLNVPTYGFLFETLILNCQIDENLLLSVAVQSENKQQDTQVWEFDELRFSYNLPV